VDTYRAIQLASGNTQPQAADPGKKKLLSAINVNPKPRAESAKRRVLLQSLQPESWSKIAVSFLPTARETIYDLFLQSSKQKSHIRSSNPAPNTKKGTQAIVHGKTTKGHD
jgi:hypothetical protein